MIRSVGLLCVLLSVIFRSHLQTLAAFRSRVAGSSIGRVRDIWARIASSMLVKARTSRIGPSSAPSKSAFSSRSACRRSRPVVAVDRDIFLGEVAGQHAVLALAQAQRHLDLDLWLLHRLGNLGLVVGRIARAAG